MYHSKIFFGGGWRGRGGGLGKNRKVCTKLSLEGGGKDETLQRITWFFMFEAPPWKRRGRRRHGVEKQTPFWGGCGLGRWEVENSFI